MGNYFGMPILKFCWIWILSWGKTLYCISSTAKKNIEKKHLCNHDYCAIMCNHDYCYFCKSNIPVINLIVGSGNVIKLSKIWVCKKLGKRREPLPPNTDNFFIKKETLTLVFSCEFSEISKNTFLQNTS